MLDEVVARSLAEPARLVTRPGPHVSGGAVGPARARPRRPSGGRPPYARQHVRGARGPHVPGCVTLRRARRGRPADAALVSRPANVRYLTGVAPPVPHCCSGPTADVLVGPAAAAVRTTTSVAIPTTDCAPPVLPPRGRPGRGRRRPGRDGAPRARRRGAPSDRRPPPRHRLRRRRAAAGGPGRPVEQLRLVKDDEEIAALRIAAEITDQALGELLESILVGRTERHLALELERRLDRPRRGRLRPSPPPSPPARNSGPRGTVPPTGGSRRATSCPSASAPTTAATAARSAVRSSSAPLPADWQVELYDLVFAAQRAGREALAPGMACRDVDRAARQVLEARRARRGAGRRDGTRGGTGNRRGPSALTCGHG